MRSILVFSLAVSTSLVVGASASAREPFQLDSNALVGMPHKAGERPLLSGRGPIQVNGGHSGIQGIHSLINFTGQYTYPGVDSNGNPQSVWPWAMVGRSPRTQMPSVIPANIIPVKLQLLDKDGNVASVNGQPLVYDASQFVDGVLNSPIFRFVKWGTSIFPTQYLDAFMRAQFWKGAGDGDLDGDDHISELWHTWLFPLVRTTRTMQLPFGSYYYALNKDGTCCKFVLADEGAFGNALFPPTATDTTTPIGAAENAGEMTTHDISTFLFPNTFLYSGGDPNNCCVVGYHAFDYEPDAQGNLTKWYVMDYSSWVTPGLFGDGGFADVTAMSHELAELFADPFIVADGVHNATQWWQSGAAPFQLCQNNLEVGDVIEVYQNSTYPVTIDGVTYHPQTEALLQWFAGESPSSAWHHAYSWPDTTVLTAPAPSLGVMCAPLPSTTPQK
jgi:hypothetical protein